MTMSTESNKAIVRRYFEEALDQRNLDVLDEIVAIDCIIHRPEAAEPIRGLKACKHALERILQVYSEFTTTIHDLIAEEDRVACRLSHRAVNRGEWTSRLLPVTQARFFRWCLSEGFRAVMPMTLMAMGNIRNPTAATSHLSFTEPQ
jgi:predicted ester cyclase